VSNVKDATSELKRQIDEAVASLRGRTSLVPEVGVILGTGLGTLAEGLTVETRIPTRTSRTSRSRPSRATRASWCSASSAAAPRSS
jgi:purine nucleoside phosphorylase